MRLTSLDFNSSEAKLKLVIRKHLMGKLNNCWTTENKKAYINEEVFVKWIDLLFPKDFFKPDSQTEKCLVVDSASAHRSKKVKAHCKKRNIKLVIIPGGLTAYVQAADVCLFKPFKHYLSNQINEWKSSDKVNYTARQIPK